jgi:hypothetical protein
MKQNSWPQKLLWAPRCPIGLFSHAQRSHYRRLKHPGHCAATGRSPLCCSGTPRMAEHERTMRGQWRPREERTAARRQQQRASLAAALAAPLPTAPAVRLARGPSGSRRAPCLSPGPHTCTQ